MGLLKEGCCVWFQKFNTAKRISYIITTVCLSVRSSVRLSVRRRFRVLIDAAELARTVRFRKRDLENGSRDSEKRATRPGWVGLGAGQGPSVHLSCRAG